MIFGPPPVRGVGRAGGFMVMIEDRGDLGPQALQGRPRTSSTRPTNSPSWCPAATPRSSGPTSRRSTSTLNRTRRDDQGGQTPRVFQTCRSTWARSTSTTSTCSAEPGRSSSRRGQVPGPGRRHPAGSRSAIRAGQMVPLGSLADVQRDNGPFVLTRYNMYPAALINGAASPGVSSGQAIDVMDGAGRRRAARRRWPRMDRDGLSRAPGGQHGHDRFRLRRGDGLPGPGRAVRELVAAAGGDPGRCRCAS